jgi:hypothetical protein
MTESSTHGILGLAFYGAMLLTIVFFVHKVLWFVEVRKIQARLVGRALSKLRERTETTLLRFDRSTGMSWVDAHGEAGGRGPIEFVCETEEKLRAHGDRIAQSRRPIREGLVRTVRGEALAPAGEVVVLAVPRLEGETITIGLDLPGRGIAPSRGPDPSLFALEVRSRYGMLRRALAFFIGAADVVYSSAHVARMSQNDAIPGSVLLRRMSLVVLILVAIVVDIAFGAREALIAWSGKVLRRGGVDSDAVGELASNWLPNLMGLVLWLGAYGAIYVGVFLFLRRRSAAHMRRLTDLRATTEARAAEIVARQRDSLLDWVDEYGRTLDEASALAVRQADMLVERAIDRLRRRLASPQLLGHAERVARALFELLPESSTRLGDVATDYDHTFAHYVWPRPAEMRYQVELAQYRAAFRDLELSLNELRGPRPDPNRAQQLWRNLVAYARMFREVLPPGAGDELATAYGESIARVVEDTEVDLRDLDLRISQLAEGLERTFSAASALLEGRIQLADENVEAEMAAFTAEVLRVREQARLEAMAFEI